MCFFSFSKCENLFSKVLNCSSRSVSTQHLFIIGARVLCIGIILLMYVRAVLINSDGVYRSVR